MYSLPCRALQARNRRFSSMGHLRQANPKFLPLGLGLFPVRCYSSVSTPELCSDKTNHGFARENSSEQSLYNLIPGKSELLRRGSTLSDSEFIEWFRGISDGEACFHINLKQKGGSVVSAEFRYSIQLHKDDEPLLLYIQKRLGFGTVKIYGNAVQFNVGAKENILNIIEIFSNHPLNTTKMLNFLTWKEAFEIYAGFRSKSKVERGEIEKNVFVQINKLKDLFNTNRKDFELPKDHLPVITRYWLLGFIEGEGSFYMQKSQYVVRFEIGQNILDEKVMLAIREFLLKLPCSYFFLFFLIEIYIYA